MASDVIIHVKRSLYLHPKILLAHTPTRNKWICKAFDKVPHNRLLLKLNHYGIQGQTLSWIKAFLTGRTQSVVLEGAKSEAVPVIYGVPQGTVLGPTLFLLYINDLPLQVSSSTTRLFADDCIVYREIDSPADAKLLQHDLDALQNWERTWLMSFNPKKCSVMSFRPCRNSHNIEYTIHETVLTRSKTWSWTSSFWWLQMDNPHLPHHKEGVPAAVLCPQKHQKPSKIIQRNCL